MHKKDACDAGVAFNTLPKGPLCPCFSDERSDDKRKESCPKYEPRTAEEIAAREADIRKAVERITKSNPWVCEMKKKFRGKGVQAGVCPICSASIQFSVSGYNGHMHCACSTKDCLNFIE